MKLAAVGAIAVLWVALYLGFIALVVFVIAKVLQGVGVL